MSEEKWGAALSITKLVVYLLYVVGTLMGLVAACTLVGALVGAVTHQPIIGLLAAVGLFVGAKGGLDLQTQRICNLLFPAPQEPEEKE